jgi:HlyD family secretion protein
MQRVYESRLSRSGVHFACPQNRRYAQRLGALLALLIAPTTTGVLLLRPWNNPANASAYRTALVERGDLVVTVAATGTLNPVVTVDVGSQVSGQVEELYADFNSRVTQGQVIARIDPETYRAKAAEVEAALEYDRTLVLLQRMQIERARVELEKARAQHAAAKAATARAELAADLARRQLDRRQSLAKRAVVSIAERERIENAHESAQTEVTAARAQELLQLAAIRAAELAVGSADVELKAHLERVKQREAAVRQSMIDLKNTEIRAPVTGTVVNRNVNRGQTVAASLQSPTLFTIAQDLRQMQVHAAVVEADVGRFAPGQRVTYSVDAYPGRTFTGEVVQIRKSAQVTQNVVTYVVVISTENPDEALLPGMTANLRVVVANKHDVLLVPNAALRFRPADWHEDQRHGGDNMRVSETGEAAGDLLGTPGRVFVVDQNGRPSAVQLRLGASDGRMTEVVAGELAEGQVVLTGAQPPARASRPGGFQLL